MTEDEMVEWHHRSMDIEQPLGDGDAAKLKDARSWEEKL